MKKSIRYIVLFLLVITSGFWISLQFEAVQTWGKSRVSHYIKQETGCQVTTGSFRGAPPFLLGLDDIELTHPDMGVIKIDSIDIIPSWLEMMFGRISFLWITANGIDLTQAKFTNSNDIKTSRNKISFSKEMLPKVSFAIHSFHLTDAKVPKAYYEPLLNTYSDQSTTCVFSVNGNVYWNPRNENFSAGLNITPYAGDSSPITLDASVDVTKQTTTLTTSVDALKVGDGSVFFSLPCDRISFDAKLQAKTQNLLKAVSDFVNSESTIPIDSEQFGPLFTGSWNVNAIHREKKHGALNPVIRFTAAGNFQAANNDSFSFETSEVTCQKIEPIQSYTQSKKERTSQELLLANADDPQDASTLSRITNIPTPQSIRGNLQRQNATIQGTLIASSFTFGDHTIPICTASVRFTPIEKGCDGTFKADVSLLQDTKELPLTFSTNFTSKNATLWNFNEVSFNIAGHTIAGDLQVNCFPFALDGKLESKNDNARDLAELLNATIEKFHVLATFAHDEITQKMDVKVGARNFFYKGFLCSMADLAISSNGLFSNPAIKTTFDAKAIENESVLLNTIHFESSFNSNNSPWDQTISIQNTSTQNAKAGSPYSLQISGESMYGPCSLTCTGTFAKNFFILDSFGAVSGGHTVKNSTPLHATYENDTLKIYPFEFTSDTDMLLQGDMLVTSDDMLDTSITYRNLPLEFFDPFLSDITLFGNISGNIDLSGKKQDPQLTMSLTSSALSLWNPNKIHALPLSLSSEITVTDKLLHITSEVEGLSINKPTVFELSAPLEFGPSSITFSDSKKLSGHLKAEFDSNTILSSYLDEDELMEGLIEIDAKLSGYASKPIVCGNVNWKDGKLFIPASGTLFNGVQMTGYLQDNTLCIEKLKANDNVSGVFEANGWVKNLLSKKLHYQLDGKATEFTCISLDEARATGTGVISLSGDLTQTNLSGTFDVTDVTFTLSPTLAKDVPNLDITYIGTDNQPLAPTKKQFLFGMDLDLNLEKGVVRGMGLESTWKGNAHVKGQNKKIDVEGKILLSKGTIAFAGKTFDLSQGFLEFHGDLPKKSMLHVLAVNEVGSIHTQIILQGPLDSPRIVIQSNPTMSQKEILSWLLFNKSSSDISPMQGIQLGQNVLKLKGMNGGVDVIEEIKQKLHIDRLDFGAGQSAGPQINSPGASGDNATSAGMQETIPNEVSVQVGKYISDGVIVTLSKDVTNEVNRVGVEANLSQHITAQANVGDDAQTEVSLEWKLRY